eukprot:TRINITY_DN12291_c0_g1_i1.p1 TRINITY_DN12291_c0_g1~~TRINITY_DN12291_c0_g1_i1.p1  ORF type:complete len:639 (+),score=278.74 TRINITY_DN12291_c0_g1_i1:96-1919(+)
MSSPAAGSPRAPKGLCPKKGLDALWPIHGKRVLVRVDFNVPIKGGVIQNDYRIRSALPTIRKIIDQGGIAIIMSHLGRPKGVSMPKDPEAEEHRKTIRRWVEERGAGKTQWFTLLPEEDKVAVLSQTDILPTAQLPSKWGGKIPVSLGSGKTAFFSTLPEDTKTQLLSAWQAKTKKEREQLPFLRNYQGYEEECTLKPVAERLGQLLGKHVSFAQDCIAAHGEVERLVPGDVLVLENVRFYKEESSKKKEERMRMAEVLASYGDYYVCDAFGTAHRDAASITGIPAIKRHGVAGTLMKKEIDYFCLALTNPERPMCAIVGGSKVTDKIKVLDNLADQVNKLLIGGAMAYVFLKVKGFNVGKSFCEKGQSFTDQYGETKDTIAELAKGLIKKCEDNGVELYLPVDHITWTKFEATDHPNVTEDENVPEDHMALDIGPRTAKKYAEVCTQCRTIVWNGPMGVFEIPTYAQGTYAVARALAESTGITIIGGGDSASAAEQSGYAADISHISTGGGASLELLEGKQLPGIAALDNAPESAEAIQQRQLMEIKNSVRTNEQALLKLAKTLDDFRARVSATSDVLSDARRAVLNAAAVVCLLFVARRFFGVQI